MPNAGCASSGTAAPDTDRRREGLGALSRTSATTWRRSLITWAPTRRTRTAGRALDDEVRRLLEKNAATIRGANVDYAEMFRKAKRMLAEKKKIPL
ncbi:MAG TPA: DUF507 family protein [Thermoanaerobaculia bacterium]|nr:DUF507 family protein [Thermoanaerobaculia bacterium]